jgi:hypothetical protein
VREPPRRWTDEEDQLLVVMLEAGKRPSAIAKELKRNLSCGNRPNSNTEASRTVRIVREASVGRRVSVALGLVGRFELAPDVLGNVAYLGLHIGL